MQSSITRKPRGPIQTNLPVPYSNIENIERGMDNLNTLENHTPLEVPINTAPEPEVIGQSEMVVNIENQNANILNEHRIEIELTKLMGKTAITIKTEGTTMSNDKNINIASNCISQIDVPMEYVGTENTGSMGTEESNISIKEEKLFDTEIVNKEDDVTKTGFKIYVISRPIQPNKELDLSNEENHNINTVIKMTPEEREIELMQCNSELGLNNEANDVCAEIKKEPEEIIIKKLEDLGDDFTVSVLCIEDPFVCVEISDSSDDED